MVNVVVKHSLTGRVVDLQPQLQPLPSLQQMAQRPVAAPVPLDLSSLEMRIQADLPREAGR